jgi:hypothetical protein
MTDELPPPPPASLRYRGLVALACVATILANHVLLQVVPEMFGRSFDGLSTNDALIWGYAVVLLFGLTVAGGVWLVRSRKRLGSRIAIAAFVEGSALLLCLAWITSNLPKANP